MVTRPPVQQSLCKSLANLCISFFLNCLYTQEGSILTGASGLPGNFNKKVKLRKEWLCVEAGSKVHKNSAPAWAAAERDAVKEILDILFLLLSLVMYNIKEFVKQILQ